MPKKLHKPEETVAKLRQVDVLVSPEVFVPANVRAGGCANQTGYAAHAGAQANRTPFKPDLSAGAD